MSGDDVTALKAAQGFIEWARADRHLDSKWTITRAEARIALAELEAAEARVGELETALREIADCAGWYVRCLEDVQDRRPVRGLAEAKAWYDQSCDLASEALASSPGVNP